MSDDDLFLPARAVRKRYSKSDMAIHRWLQDAKLGFPKPSYICGYRHWKLSELLKWEQTLPAKKGAAEAA